MKANRTLCDRLRFILKSVHLVTEWKQIAHCAIGCVPPLQATIVGSKRESSEHNSHTYEENHSTAHARCVSPLLVLSIRS